jgi:hypothetical protein
MSVVPENTHAVVDCGEESIDQEFWMSAPRDLTEGRSAERGLFRGLSFGASGGESRCRSGRVVGEIPHVAPTVKADVAGPAKKGSIAG